MTLARVLTGSDVRAIEAEVARKLPSATRVTRMYIAAHMVVVQFLGVAWSKSNLEAEAAHTMRNVGDDKFARMVHEMRVVELASNLLSCQQLEGFARQLPGMRSRTLEGLYFELDLACTLTENDHDVEFVVAGGPRGTSYDLKVDASLAVEIKAKNPNTPYSDAALRTTIRRARSQLPRAGPGLVAIAVPGAWVAEDRMPSMAGVIESALRNTTRINAVQLFWDTWTPGPHGGYLCSRGVRTFSNPTPATALGDLTCLIRAVDRKDATITGFGDPRSDDASWWLDLRPKLGNQSKQVAVVSDDSPPALRSRAGVPRRALHPDKSAAVELGLDLQGLGEVGEAKQAFELADRRGHASGAYYLAQLLIEQGEVQSAEAAFMRADKRGSAAAAYELGVMLHERGDSDAAEAAYARADQRGNAEGANNHAVLLEQRGDLDGAIAAYRRADERGSGRGPNNLGRQSEVAGDLRGAEAAYRRADERGDAAGAFNLGRLLERRNDSGGAETAYERADARGSAAGATNLGWMLLQRGDQLGAQAALERGDSRGDALGARHLGNLFHEQGDAAQAEAAWTRADERGDAGGANNLGALLAQRGDLDGAEAAWRRADERGDAAAAGNLASLYEVRGDVVAAKSAWRRAAARGDSRRMPQP